MHSSKILFSKKNIFYFLLIQPDRQTAMFSATWPKQVQKLASDFMTNCSHITLGSAMLNANQNIQQIVDVCEENEKESK